MLPKMALYHDGNQYPTDLDKANCFNDFFNRCFNTSCQPISTVSMNNDWREDSPDIICSVDEVWKLLKSLDTSKASGPDDISARMLKLTADEIAPSISKFFNHSITCCRPPSCWKVSSVVPVPKIGKANTKEDYRPISFLPIVSKVLERYFYSLISEHLLAASTLANCQWGFQRGKSTISAVLHTTYDWLEHLEKGAEIGAVLFDYKKAFDSIPHSPLLSKLEANGLDPHIITWIHNYLAERQQQGCFQWCVICAFKCCLRGTTSINPRPTVVFYLY